MNSAKIVAIHGGKGMGSNANSIKPLDVCLVTLRDSMKSKVLDLLRKLFENADDALFALSDKAGRNDDQSAYFDAMRELRLQRKQIATEVVLGVIRSFNEVGSYRAESHKIRKAGDLEELTLVENDELELNVALEGMVNRLRNASASTLRDLHTRVESLIFPAKLALDQTPASPEILCDGFAKACKNLNMGIRVRLVVLKLFEKYVLAEMARVYGAANQLLIKQGIKPELNKKPDESSKQIPRMVSSSTAPMRTANPPSARAKPEDGVPVLQPLTTEVSDFVGAQLDALRELLHKSEGHQKSPANASTPGGATYYSQSDLVSALSMFQRQQSAPTSDLSNYVALDFRGLLNGSLAKAKGAGNLSEMDSDVINLVTMLFEFILDDRQLQPTMKAIIGRLQIPILKVAVIDQSFFNRGGHPARKLLNEMASAAIGWNEKKDGKPDPLKDKMEQVMRTVLSEFDHNVGIFAELLEDFMSFVQIERRRGQLVEQRTKDSEQGKAASDVANLAVESVLNNAMMGKNSIPECAVRLLREGWSRLMVLRYLKDGENSESWKASCELVKDLIWTVSPEPKGSLEPNDSATRTTLLRMIPGVIKRLRDGLHEIAFDEFKLTPLLRDLEDAQVEAIHQLQTLEFDTGAKVAQPIADGSPKSEPKTERKPVLLAEQDQAVAELVRETQEMEEEFTRFQQLSEAQALANVQPLQAISGLNEVAMQAETAEPKQAVIATEEIILASLDLPKTEVVIDETDPFVQQVDKLSSGCWFEFQNEGRSERCKLAAVIRATGKYIFVNRAGVKVAEKTKMGLAVELRRGSVQILNDGLLFDRALESVISNLRGRYKAE